MKLICVLLYLIVYFVYYFYDDFTAIIIILFIVWIRFHRRILTKHPQNCRTDKEQQYQHYIILCNLEIIQVNSY